MISIQYWTLKVCSIVLLALLFFSCPGQTQAEDWQLHVTYPGLKDESWKGIYPSQSLCRDVGERLALEWKVLRSENLKTGKRDPGPSSYECLAVDIHAPSVKLEDCLIGLGYADPDDPKLLSRIAVTRAVRPGESYRPAPGETAIGLVREDLSFCHYPRILRLR